MGQALPRCRTCPRCGSRKYRRVARNFLPGTWRQCLDCREEYRPPVYLGVSIAAVLFGSFMLSVAGMSVGLVGVSPLTLTFGPVGAGFVLWGVWQIVRWARTPMGPLKAFAVVQAGE